MKEKIHEIPITCSEKCSVIHALEVIGGKWKIPIIWILLNEKNLRYNELKRRLPGITNIMLTRSLQALEDQGLVKRIEYNKVPPHVEYFLTDICYELRPAFKVINEWGEKFKNNTKV